MYPSLVKEFLTNTAFGGGAFAFVQTAVSASAAAGQAAPSSFWQFFATLALSSLMTLAKWYFDDRKSSRANAATLVTMQEQINSLRSELEAAQKLKRRRRPHGPRNTSPLA